MTRADTIARHLHQAGTHLKNAIHAPSVTTGGIDAAMRCINLAFLETLGGAAVAGEAAGPWVVRVQHNGRTWWDPGVRDLDAAQKFKRLADAESLLGTWRNCPSYPGATATVLPLAEAERMEAEGPPQPAPRFVPVSTPEPPKPAGWVVRHSTGVVRWLCTRTRDGAWPKHEPYATREDAQRIADTTGGEAVPVDAAGNVIESLPGVAWEAARAGEEAERLRTELAAVKAERDALNAAEADLRHALRQIAELVGGAVSLGASTDMHCAVANEVRVVVADLRAERDALAAEVQRSREQKPYLIKTRALAEDAARRRACTVAPLYLAPVVRDHSGVIAQCEEALREWDRKGPHCSATSSLVAVTLTKARNALQGAS